MRDTGAGPVSALAKMYQARVPTGPTTVAGIYRQRVVPPQRMGTGPTAEARQRAQSAAYKIAGTRAPEVKVGPQGVTADAVRRVAQFGLRALPRTVIPEVGPGFELPAGTEKAINAEVIGQPGPGYGEKYGGFSTMGQWQDAIVGEALGAYEMADLAKQQAAAAREPYYKEMAGRVAERVQPIASLAGVRPGATLSAQDRARLAAGYQGVQEFGRTPEYEAAKEYEATMNAAGGLFGQPQMTANQMMRAAYETMLGGRALSPEDQAMVAQRATGELGWFPEEIDLYNRRASTDPYVAGPEQLATMLESTPISQLAQQIAIQRYGMDPNQAAGLFGQEFQTAYDQAQMEAQMQQAGGATIGQQILSLYGPEGFQQYMAKAAEEAMFGTKREQQRYADELQAEQNRQNDELIASTYGFYPDEISGIPADTVRQRMADANFQKLLRDSLAQVDKGTFNMNVADEAYNAWMTQTNDRVGARLLQEIIAKFTPER